jgi:uncharacterized protein YdaU (DUF1376 family)
MNYYERHIGDYLKDTAHLSLLEHGVYSRLMDVYYTKETGIPKAEAIRLIGARSKEEKNALDIVLTEFFVLDGGTYKQARCDREIARFQAKQESARRSANARWNNQSSHSDGNPNGMRTHSDGNAPRHQTPDTSNQTPDINTKDKDSSDPLPNPTRAGAVCVVVKSVGLTGVNPHHPKLLALLDDGAQVQEFEDAARKAIEVGKGFAYALGIVKNARDDAKRQPKPTHQAESFKERDDRRARERWEQMTGQTHPDNVRNSGANVIDVTPFVSSQKPMYLEISQ